MKLTGAQIGRFQDLYKQHFGEELDIEKAQTLGLSLLNLMHHTYQPITQQQLEETKMRQKTILNN